MGVLSNSLLRACSSQKYRDFLRQKSLVLISPFNPEAGFDVGNAMQRNKYIYCLSDAAVVVHSGREGGTWAGATENLKKGWVPLWVKRTEDVNAGNRLLVQQGARWLSDKVHEVDCNMLITSKNREGLFPSEQPGMHFPGSADSPKSSSGSTPVAEEKKEAREVNNAVKEAPVTYTAAKPLAEVSFYEFFLAKMQHLCSDKAVSAEELAQTFGLQRAQINVWLRKALADGFLVKLTKPVRYQWKKGGQQVLPLE
ncbi:MAG: hypothetical protein D6681_12660 [Calditrichaeota bacterium]|nr:MAG: hypothetical protein D6681_12660 [Calditrichota bacterium]